MHHISKGTTSFSIFVKVKDSSSSTGAGLTGLAYNTSSLTAYYTRMGGSPTAITLATLAAITTAWSSGGFKEVDATNQPGVYRLDVPDAVLATGADEAVITLRGATNMVSVDIGIQLLPVPANVTLLNGGAANQITNVNGIPYATFLNMQLSDLAGRTTVADNGDGTSTIVWYLQDNTTEVYRDIVNNTTGARAAKGTIA